MPLRPEEVGVFFPLQGIDKEIAEEVIREIDSGLSIRRPGEDCYKIDFFLAKRFNLTKEIERVIIRIYKEAGWKTVKFDPTVRGTIHPAIILSIRKSSED